MIYLYICTYVVHFIDIIITPRKVLELPLSFPDTLFPLSGSQLELKIKVGILVPNKY